MTDNQTTEVHAEKATSKKKPLLTPEEKMLNKKLADRKYEEKRKLDPEKQEKDRLKQQAYRDRMKLKKEQS
jgi:hypothetical protein